MRKFSLICKNILDHRTNSVTAVLLNKRRFSTVNNDKDDSLENFNSMVERRRGEAGRSIVVEVADASCAEAVWRQCSVVGPVTALIHYSTPFKNVNKQQKKLLLVEFANSASVRKMLDGGSRVDEADIPVKSIFLRHVPTTTSADAPAHSDKSCPADNANDRDIEMPKLVIEENITENNLKIRLQECANISEQIQTYYNYTKSSDLQNRLRFLTCRQLEVALSGVFPQAAAMPFGSSVNGFGNSGSDLDVVLGPGGLGGQQSYKCPDLKFVQMNNTFDYEKRSLVVRYLGIVAKMLYMLPGCVQIIEILKARVPIVRYNQKLTGLECDLSMSNWSGVYMSEMLYNYCQLEPRFAPLVCYLRLWAREHNLTSPHPGRWITNFMVSMLTLHYLMTIKLLPPLQVFKNCARAEDSRTAEDSLDCTFLRDMFLAQGLVSSSQELRLEDLLLGFFQYYLQFDFDKKAVSILTGKVHDKPRRGALYIENPLSPDLNVSRNVTVEEVERFKATVAGSYRLLTCANKSSDEWGLSLLQTGRDKQEQLFRRASIDWNQVFDKEPQTEKKNASKTVRDSKNNGDKSLNEYHNDLENFTVPSEKKRQIVENNNIKNFPMLSKKKSKKLVVKSRR